MAVLTREEFRLRERVRALLGRIDRDADCIIVEGAADRRVLQELGVETRIAACTAVEAAARAVGGAETVVILTDFDAAGKELNRAFRQRLAAEADVMGAYRKQFGQLMAVDNRRCVEDLAPLLRSPFDTVVETRRAPR